MARYKGIVEGQIIPELGRVKLAKLQPVDVDRMLSRLQANGLSPRTASHVRAVLRAALGTAERRGQVVRNVATLSEPVRVAKVPLRILSPGAAWGLLGAIEDPQLRRLATLAVHSGLRQGELLGLVWSDVDWEGGQLHVSQALQRIGGAYRRVEVKSGSSRRAVPLTPAAVGVLAAERDAQAVARDRAGSRWHEPVVGLVFTTATGQPRNGTTITHQFADALAAANLAPMPFHDLRHAFATLMFASGVDSGTVSALMGHSSVSLTMSTYAGVAPSLKRQATDQLARLLAHP
jgi:integrase